jgi:outer membrane protein TolC
MRTLEIFTICMLMMSVLITGYVAAETRLELKHAEKLAIERDAVLQMKRAQSEAHYEASVADDTLPDPRIKLGLMNYPTDTFDRDQEPMTQNLIAIQQMIPRGDTQEIKSHQSKKSGDVAWAEAIDRERKVIMQVRSVYLDLIYWNRAEQIVNQNKLLFKNLVKITESQYASGIQRQQDVIRAELELDMLDDRLDEIKTRQESNRARLVKLIGEQDGGWQIVTDIPELTDLSDIENRLEQLEKHPQVMMAEAKIGRNQFGVELARQSYKPNWMFEVSYGIRDGTNPNGTERADFASAMISFDVPLFTGDKQDRQVAASKLNYQASIDAREEVIRQLNSEYQQAMSTWLRLQGRLARYRSEIVPQARENASASLHAYQSRRGDFTSLMRARITELETNLKHFRMQTNLLKTQAKLLYLLGEEQ